jgi:uncharacterized protein YndB with AHSA1/START domain
MEDRIEHSVLIEAPLDRVWDLVTEPGWWVPSDAGTPIDRTPGAVTVRTSGQYGSFPVQVVQLEPKVYAAFRWASAFAGEDLVEGKATLVEFHIAAEDDAVRVTVVESGFASLDVPDDMRRKEFEGNLSGWSEEMESLRQRAKRS